METTTIEYDEILVDTGIGGAKRVEIDGDGTWIPNSLISNHDESRKEMDIPVWFAEKEGLV